MTAEDRFLSRLANGKTISQDDYNQMVEFIAPETLADALVKRFEFTGDMRTLVEAALLYLQAGYPFKALEVCSRFPKEYALRQVVKKLLPALRQEYQEDYPSTTMVGKLLDEAFLVIDLSTGGVTRYPPIMPSTESAPAAPQELPALD